MINQDIKDKIHSYISGELSDLESSEVKKLIESSEEFNAYYQEINNMWGMLEKFETLEPSTEYAAKFWDKVESEKNRTGFTLLNLFNLNKKWAFAGSFGVFVVICSFVINSYVANNGNGIYFNNFDDETLLTNLDESINPKTPDSLKVYGPWDDLEN